MTRFRIVAVALMVTCSICPQAAEANPACGSTLTADTTLTSDMSCAGTALVIGADGITVDLNGHTLSGDGVTLGAAGVRNVGYTNVTIENGTITGFDRGIHLSGASNNTIRAITVDSNFFFGMRGNEFDSNVRGIVVSLGGGSEPPGNNLFTGNRATGNGAIDVVDQTIGDGTIGTDSTYRGTRWDTSSPAGICVP